MKLANWYLGIGLLAVIFALPTLAGAWSYEQIEGPGNWAQVELEVMPTGMVCVCYHDSVSGHTFVAHKDSVWHRDDLGEWTDTVGHHLVRGPDKRPAVLLESDTITVYALLAETGWVLETLGIFTSHAFLGFDSLGEPASIYYYPYGSQVGLSTAHRQGGIWSVDTLELGYQDPLWWRGPVTPTTFVLGPGNRFYDDRGHFVGYTMGYSEVYVDTGRTRAWGVMFTSQGRYASAVSMSPGPFGDFASCYNEGDLWARHHFYCNNDSIETLWVSAGRVRIDSRDIPQIVYRLGVMKLAYRTGVWHIDTLPPEINAAASFDFAIDAEDMPLIAFSTPDSIFLATGDAVGISEKSPQAIREPPRLPTIVRGTLLIPRSLIPDTRPPIALFDINGRKVLDIRPSPHAPHPSSLSVDVSRLAPGVYFVRSADGGQRSAEKIVIQK